MGRDSLASRLRFIKKSLRTLSLALPLLTAAGELPGNENSTVKAICVLRIFPMLELFGIKFPYVGLIL